MWHQLYGFTVKTSRAFFFNQFFKNRTRKRNRITVRFKIQEAFIVAEIKIGFHPIMGHITFTMFHRVQKPCIHIQIRVALLHCHLKALGLQNSPDRSRRNSLSYSRKYSAGHEDIFTFMLLVLFFVFIFHGTPLLSPTPLTFTYLHISINVK